MKSDSDVVKDYITGQARPDIGAEANRQRLERLLVEDKGFAKADIEVDAPLVLDLPEGPYRSRVDLVVALNGRRIMAIKCAAGSLASREREVIAAARLLDAYQIPLAVASDGHDAYVWETVSGGLLGQGLQWLPTKQQALAQLDSMVFVALDPRRRERQAIIFRSYDSMNINTALP